MYSLSHFLTFIPYKWQMHFNEKVPPNCGMHDSPFSYAPPDTWLGFIYFTKQNRVLISRQAEKLLACCRAKVKKSSHPKNPILSPLSYCRHVVVGCQYSHLTIKNYHWLLLVSAPKTTSRKPLASGFFLNYWHSHLYNQTPSFHGIHQSIARVILLSTNPTTNLLVLYYSTIKNEFSE